jgi:hypothetical protein
MLLSLRAKVCLCQMILLLNLETGHPIEYRSIYLVAFYINFLVKTYDTFFDKGRLYCNCIKLHEVNIASINTVSRILYNTTHTT